MILMLMTTEWQQVDNKDKGNNTVRHSTDRTVKDNESDECKQKTEQVSAHT